MAKITIEIDQESFVAMLNVLCDAMLEDEMLTKLCADKNKIRLCDTTIYSCACAKNSTPCAVNADLHFLQTLLPEMQNQYPDIFLYHAPILDVIAKMQNADDIINNG